MPCSVALLSLAVCTTPRSAAQSETARSVVLFIGDGVDDHQLTIARNYLHGADGAFSFDRFPHRAAAKVLTVMEEDPSVPEYVADSASGGTALAAGVVTSRGRIATAPKSGEDVVTLVELAQRAGKRTGIVATSSVTDATPASFAAHARIRYCEGPKDMLGSFGGLLPGCPEDLKSKGGPGSIAEQLAVSRIDVLLGGGYEHFDQANEEGVSILDLARQNGYQIVRDARELEKAIGSENAEGARVLALFGDGTLPVEWAGRGGRRALPLQFDNDGQPVEPRAFSCVANPRFGDRPTLEAMTRKALKLLEPAEKGFFLMVESASIDKQAHAGNPCGQIGETRALDRAVAAAVEYQERHPDTLVLVASDHGHAAQIVPWPSLFIALARVTGQAQHPAGKVALIETPEGGRMAISYATNKNFLEEHTGTQIPVFAQGPGAAAVRGLIRQSDVFEILRRAMGL